MRLSGAERLLTCLLAADMLYFFTSGYGGGDYRAERLRPGHVPKEKKHPLDRLEQPTKPLLNADGTYTDVC